MEKTKSGISVGAAGAVIYFSALLGGYTPLFLLSGYVFIKEDSGWLKKAAFKAIALMLVFSAMGAFIDMLNEFLDIFNSLFEWELEIPLNIDYALKNAVSIAKTVVFSILGFRAFWKKDLPIKSIDNAVSGDK